MEIKGKLNINVNVEVTDNELLSALAKKLEFDHLYKNYSKIYLINEKDNSKKLIGEYNSMYSYKLEQTIIADTSNDEEDKIYIQLYEAYNIIKKHILNI